MNEDVQNLYEIAISFSFDEIKSDAVAYENAVLDLIHASAKAAGNSYSRSEVDGLLRLGLTAGGKPLSDARMLMVLRDAFNTTENYAAFASFFAENHTFDR